MNLKSLDLKFYLAAPKQDGSSRINKHAPNLPAASVEKDLSNQRFILPTADQEKYAPWRLASQWFIW